MAQRKLLRITSGGIMFEVRAYGILPDEQNMYHYLVGYSRPYKSKDEEIIASFRLSRIDYDKTRMLSSNNNHSGKVTKTQKKAIENAIANRGVMFLMQQKKIVYIRLNEAGKKIYERKQSKRPILSVPPEYSEYYGRDGVFVCSGTAWNIEDYFFDFGPDVEILAPEALRERFAERYYEAYKQYAKA